MKSQINKKITSRATAIRRRLRMIMAMAVVFTTAYSLVLPAIAVEKNAAAGIPGVSAGTAKHESLSCHFDVHQHTEACYEQQPVMDQDGNPTGKAEKVLICGKSDRVAHKHDERCYQTVQKQVVIDGTEQTVTEKELVCKLPELEAHEHDRKCYETENVLTCEKAELHTHTAKCYENGPNGESPEKMGWITYATNENDEKVLVGDPKHLICGKKELPAHQHTDACFVTDETENAEAAEVASENASNTDTAEVTSENAANTDTAEVTNEDAAGTNAAVMSENTEDKESAEVAIENIEDAAVVMSENAEGTEDAGGKHLITTEETEKDESLSGDGDESDENNQDWIYLDPESDSDEETPESDSDEKAPEADSGKDTPDAANEFDQSVEVPVEGASYSLTVRYNSLSGIPENAVFKAAAVTKDQDGYTEFQEKAFSALEDNNGAKKMLGLFDLTIFDEDGTVIEPDAPVSVTVDFGGRVRENKKDSIYAVHFPESGTSAVHSSENGTSAAHSAEGGMSAENEGLTGLTGPAADAPVEVIETAEQKTGAVSFEAGSFSVYAIVYTVDFEYFVNGRTYEFSLPGGGFVSFTDLVEMLDIAHDTSDAENGTEEDAAEGNAVNGKEADAAKKFAANVASVKFSSPELVWVGKTNTRITVGMLKEKNSLTSEYSAELTKEQIEEINSTVVESGDWALISLRPFVSEETLTVTMKDGEAFTVKVTDAQISKQYLSANGRLYEVTVTYGEDAKIPEGASLEVTEYNKATEDYKTVRNTVSDAEKTGVLSEAAEATEAVTSAAADAAYREAALEALDITILDRNGQPIEPEAPVNVRIVMKKLPGDKNLFDNDLFKETVAVQHLNTSAGEVQVETVADTNSIGGINVSENTATADFTLDSFSQFAITYYRNNPRVVVNVHYVDNNGTELNGTTNNVTATMNQSIQLSSYQNRMNQTGYTYLGAHYGTYSGQVITSLYGTTASTGSLSNSAYIVEFRNGDDIVARQEYQSSLRQIDVYLVYAPSSGYYIQDTIGEDGCLTVKNGTNVLQTGLDQNLFVRWYRSSSASSGFQEVTQSKILNGNYNIPVLGGPKVNISIDEGADQYYKAEIYKVEDNEEVKLATTSVYHVPYYDDVRNGGFETPHNNGTTDENVNRWPSNWQVGNGQNGVIWKTTGTAADNSKRDIEIPQGAAANGSGANNLGETLRNYCFAFMPEGNQCAELNCEASGALYQDILTIPGSQIYWSLYHRARGGYDKWKTKTDKTQNKETDTMYVVAMSKELAEKYDVTTQEKVLSILEHVNNHDSEFYDVEIVKITTTNGGNGTMEFLNSGYTMTVPPTYFGNLANGQTATIYDSGTRLNFKYGNTDWHYYTGNFSIPANQYLTRFFFVAGETASGNPTMGNFLDDIKLSDSVPAPNHGQATAIIQKTVEGLDTLPENYAARIEAAYEVRNFNGTTESRDRSSDYDHYRTQIDQDGKAVSTASWTFPVTIPTGGSAAFTLGEEVSPQIAGTTDQVSGYEQTTTWSISKRSLDGETETIIARGTGKEIPASELEKLTITERDIVCIEFTNTYEKKQPVSIWKTDMNSRTITSGAEFALYKAEEFDDNSNTPKAGAEIITSGTTGTNGILYLGELEPGEYRLLETKAPAGYLLPEAAIKITVTESKVTAIQGTRISEAVAKGHKDWVNGQAEDTKQIQVWNNPGVELPSTGGPGTTPIYTLGILLITLACAGLARSRRGRGDGSCVS